MTTDQQTTHEDGEQRSVYGRQRALKPTPAFTHPQQGDQPGDAFRAMVLDRITRNVTDDDGEVVEGKYGPFKEHVLTLVISNGTATIALHDAEGDRVMEVDETTGDAHGAVERVRIDPDNPRVVRWWVSGRTAGKVGRLGLNGGDVITVVRDANDPPRQKGENGGHNYRIEVSRRGCAVGPWEQLAVDQALPAVEYADDGDDLSELEDKINDPFGEGGHNDGSDAGDPFGGGNPEPFGGTAEQPAQPQQPPAQPQQQPAQPQGGSIAEEPF